MTSSGTRERYDELMRLADLFDGSGAEMRTRAALGEQVLGDPAVAESAPLSPATFHQVDEDLRAATTGRHGLLARSVALDADALVVRATVLTYQWIDELQEAAYRTLGSIAGRAIGYLAPEVALGGAIVSAGLIETDALDRDGVAAYLDELAEQHPELMEHAAGGGGLLDGLRMRSALTAGVLSGESGPAATRGGLRAAGAEPFATDLGSALRDVAGGLVGAAVEPPVAAPLHTDRPRGLADLVAALSAATEPVCVQEVGADRYVVFLPGPHLADRARLRLVAGDHSSYAEVAVRAIEHAVTSSTGPARVLLVGCGQGGVTAVEIATGTTAAGFVVDHVVTVGAPAALVPRVTGPTRVLSLEDRSDPVALLGSLVNADAANRLTVVFDGAGTEDAEAYVAGARAADTAPHPELRAELDRIRELGFFG